jgi:hypothetical protein
MGMSAYLGCFAIQSQNTTSISVIIVTILRPPKDHSYSNWITPTAKGIETQSRSFCEHEATGLTFNFWHSSVFGPMTQTPMNNPEIEMMGMRNSTASCKQYWSDCPQIKSQLDQQINWNLPIEHIRWKRLF